MFTRLQYLNHECTYEQYFSEIAVESNAISFIQIKMIEKCKINFDEVTLEEWDKVADYFMKNNWLYTKARDNRKELNTLATAVCTLKQAVRMYLNK